jgi:hypothetical protein
MNLNTTISLPWESLEITNQRTKRSQKNRRVYYGRPLIVDTREHNKNQRNQSWALNPGSHETEQSGQRAPTPVWTRCGLPCFLIFHRNPPVLWKHSQNWSSSVQLTMVSYEEVSVCSTTTYKREPPQSQSGLHRIFPFQLDSLACGHF